MKPTLFLVFCFIILFQISCSREETKSSENAISSFELTIDGEIYTGLINPTNGKITLQIDVQVPVSLVPSMVYSDRASISPNEKSVQNFNDIIRYTVTAENGLEKIYTVVIENLGDTEENTAPSTMEFLGVEFNKREFTIDWTDAEDSDPVTYIVYKNAVEVGEFNESKATMPFAYNQTETITIFATDKKGGTSKLEFDIETPTSELIFVRNSSGILYAIDTKVRDILWVGKSVDAFFAPVLNKGEVLSSWDKKLIGLDLLTGKEMQVYDSIVSNISHSRHGDIVTENDAIYYKNGDGNIYSIDAKNGNENWKAYLSNITSMITPTKITESNLYTMRGRNDILYSIDKLSGNLDWTYNLRNGSSGGVPFYRRTPTAMGQSIFFGDNSYVYSLDKNTGKENWVINLSSPSSFTPFKQELIVVAFNAIYGINPLNGAILWSKTLTWGTVSTPFLENEALYMGIIGNGTGSIIAINANNGDELWKRDVSGSVSASPIVYDGKLYVCDREGILYCLNASNGALIWQMTVGDFVTTSPTFVKGDGDIVVYPNVLGFD